MHPLSLLLFILLLLTDAQANESDAASTPKFPPAPAFQSDADAQAKSLGCISCHTASDALSMHNSADVPLGCSDCHGGNADIKRAATIGTDNAEYLRLKNAAHVQPRFPDFWNAFNGANPPQTYSKINEEDPDYLRFINPSDYRVVSEACGACHLPIIQATQRSLMSTGAMLWGGASYNNGILPFKRYILGEAYTRDGKAAAIPGPVTPNDVMTQRGVLPGLNPLPAWETVKPGDIFRVFERGGRNISHLFPEIALPNLSGNIQRLEEPGKPDIKQSNRGPGTGARIAVPLINIHKTRLNDPFMWFMGTNDQPGDYRHSGCAGCHVIYANDRDPKHSGPYAKFGHDGLTQTKDPTISRSDKGHPLQHIFTRSIPTSQCMICHMHQPNMFMNTMLGYTMWDYESDAPSMWPKEQRYPTDEEKRKILDRNPEGAAVRGLWGDVDFLKNVSQLNPTLKDTQFADYHGHGWNFRAVQKRNRKGELLDAEGKIVANDDPKKFDKAVHLASIHIDKGMHCADCHFSQDAHGNGHIYGEVAAAVEIGCKDCHGTVDSYPSLRTSGPAAGPKGRDLSFIRNPDGRLRFEWVGKKLMQRSVVDPKLEWEVSLVKDSVNPASAHYNAKAARAKLMSKNKVMEWGGAVAPEARAHSDDSMECYACHTSWTTSCAGCHLPIEANWKTPKHHYENNETRNYATYNPQVARDEMFMLAIRETAKGGKIAPARSTSALVLSSTNSNRERIYIQQAPIAASGYSSQAINPHYPHTERKTETKTCTDCHVSDQNDNNAIMAQLLLQGTNYVNFIGRFAWSGSENGVTAVGVTEWEEPQAVMGSYLHRYAYPDFYANHQMHNRELAEQYHEGGGAANCVQMRGEYLYSAEGTRGFRVYDIANIDNKGYAQRILSAPYSPWGQGAFINSADASCVALPTTQPIAPQRNQGDLMRVVNQEQPMHPLYNYAYIVDRVEGLILVDINTFVDGEFRNNFLTRALTWNENNVLRGARHITLGGYYAYITADVGLVIVNINDPLKPTIANVIAMDDARASALQFRYLFVTTDKGLQVVNVTVPEKAVLIPNNVVALNDARKVFVARTYAYVAAGAQGIAIVDAENPEKLKLQQLYSDNGKINDANDVVIGAAYASAFLYIADGKNGLKVVQLTAPDTQPNFYGFSPTPAPQVIASSATASRLLSLSRGLERDRGVDETGGQVAVFGRLGSRPFNQKEMQRMYLNSDGTVWTVNDMVDLKKRRELSNTPARTP